MSRLAILASAVTVAVLATVVAAAPAHADANANANANARPRTAAVTHYRTLEKMLRRFSRQAGSAARPAIYAAR